MDNWKPWIDEIKNNKFYVAGLLILLALPLMLFTVYQIQNTTSRAALPDVLEAESGVTSSTGVSKQSDSSASGGQYVKFARSSNPTPTPPSSSTRGPRPAPAVPTRSNVYTIPSSIPNNGTGDVGPAISSWLGSLPSGSIALFTSANTERYNHGTDTPIVTYRLSTTGIDVPPGIVLWGYGVKINVITPGNVFEHAAFHLYPSGTTTIRGFEIAGQNIKAGTTTAHDTGRQHGTGVSIAGSSGANISANVYDTWMHHLYSDGIFVAGWGNTDYNPSGFDFGYNLIEMTGRYGIVINQNDSETAWVHHNIIKDTALNLIGGEDQRLGTEKMVNALIEENDLGTFMWHDTINWLPHGIGWNYDWWPETMPNINEVGPIIIRNNKWIGGCADAMFQRHKSATNYISQETKISASDYHDIIVENNDWSGIPSDQRSTAYWVSIHNTRNVTLKNNYNLGEMTNRYDTTGSSGVSVSGNK